MPLDTSICGSTARDKDLVPQWEKTGELWILDTARHTLVCCVLFKTVARFGYDH